MAVAFDPNRLNFATQRRFGTAWREMSGEAVVVLPRVGRELTRGNIAIDDVEASAKAASAPLARRRNELSSRQADWAETDLWWAERFAEQDGAYRLVRLTPEQQALAEEIAVYIDPAGFPNVRAAELAQNADAIIVAEAIASKCDLFVTADENTIIAPRINSWIDRHASALGIENAEMIHRQDDRLYDEFSSPETACALCAVAFGAFWPADRGSTLQAAEASFRRWCGLMPKAALPKTAKLAFESWKRVPDPAAVIEYVRENLPTRMRSAETSHSQEIARVQQRKERSRFELAR